MSHLSCYALIVKVIASSPTPSLTDFDIYQYLMCIDLALIKFTINDISILEILLN